MTSYLRGTHSKRLEDDVDDTLTVEHIAADTAASSDGIF